MSNASWLAKSLNEKYHVIDILSSFRIASSFTSVSIYLLHITNLTATQFGISHSRGMGLLGVNIFGVSSFQQALFVNNTPNCAIVFLNSYSPTETSVMYVTDSSFMPGNANYANSKFAAGFSVIAIQTTYHVNIYIRNVTAYGNTGNVLYGSILLWINSKVAI